MKRTYLVGAALALATTAASAADLPSRVAPPVFIPPPIAGYNWTGLEFGLTTSLSFTNYQSVSTSGNTPAAARFGGALGLAGVSLNKFGSDYVGGGVGYNYQFTPGSGLVVGVMGDASYFDLSKDTIVSNPAGAASVFHQRLTYLATINGRVGYAFDRILLYGTGGFAFGGVNSGGGIYAPGGALLFTGTNNGTETGYDYGGGVEYAIPPDSFLNYLSVEKVLGLDKTLGLNMFEGTVRAEFIHYDLGTKVVTLGSTAGTGDSFTSRFRTEANVVRLGLGYKFASTPTPVVAKY